MTGKFVAYYRVSTTKQGINGLGMDAQRNAVANYLNGGNWKLIGEFAEVESGKRNSRQELLKAIALCRKEQATLAIAKLDRLARNAAFLLNLRDSGVEFIAVDMPYADKFTVGIMAFRVTSVEKLPYHHLWDIRCYGTLAAQSYLLLSLPVSKQHCCAQDIVLKQFHAEIQRIAGDLGTPIRRDFVHVNRTGAYFRITFIWPLGKPGWRAKREKKAEAFSFLIRPWLRRNRN